MVTINNGDMLTLGTMLTIPACLKVAYPVRLYVEFQRKPLHPKDPRGSQSPIIHLN